MTRHLWVRRTAAGVWKLVFSSASAADVRAVALTWLAEGFQTQTTVTATPAPPAEESPE
jgi:hypothetical protein